jgi:single-strand DNA-binding protein
MSGFQKIIITGNLGQTPECRMTQNGDSVTNLSVAVNRVWYKKDDGEKQEEVTWYRVSLWREQAEDAERYLVKGQQVTVCGRLATDGFGNPPTWIDDSGQFHASFEIVPTERIVYGPKPGRNGNGYPSDEVESVTSRSRRGTLSKSEPPNASGKDTPSRGNRSSNRRSAQRPRNTARIRQEPEESQVADAWNFD